MAVPVAGWYDDEERAGYIRWWDGVQWTDFVQERPADAVRAYVEPEPVEEAPEEAAEEEIFTAASSVAPEPVSDRPLTRREMRERERALTEQPSPQGDPEESPFVQWMLKVAAEQEAAEEAERAKETQDAAS